MLQKYVRSAALFLAVLLSVGCSSDGVFETPDSIRATTLADIHGSRGHRIDINIGPNNTNPDDAGMTKQAVLELHDPDVSAHTLYLVIETSSISIGRMIDLLEDATEVAIVPDLPENTQPWTRLLLNLGGEDGDPFSGYLRISTPSETAYLSLSGTVTEEKRAWFLREVGKPSKVLDTMPAHVEVNKPPKVPDTTPVRVVEISYYLDPHLTEPIVDTVYVGDTVYTKVVFSKAPPVVIADGAAALPHLSSTLRLSEFQYRIREPGAPLQSGDAKPFRGTNHVFICKYVMRGLDFGGTFHTHAAHGAVSGDALQVQFYEYTGGIPANVGETITAWDPTDFVGQVFTVRIAEVGVFARSQTVPVAGVTVTIASGLRQGEYAVTDRNGRYRFRGGTEDTLHLRAERYRFEPKEVLVHRSRPTALANGFVPNYHGDPQREPGNILIGHVWLEEVRAFLEQVSVVHDLLYTDIGWVIDLGSDVGRGVPVGFYAQGVVASFTTQMIDRSGHSITPLHIITHEIMHAHQHAQVSIDGSGDISDWENTPEGKAFVIAREKDAAGTQVTSFDRSRFYSSNLENAAETVFNYWAIRHRWDGALLPIWGRHQEGKTLREIMPNRYQWCEQWIMKK